MTPEEQKAADAAKEQELEAQKKEQLEAEKKSLEGKSTDELLEIIRETRNEAKQRRLKEKELNDKLAAFEAEKEQEAQQKKIAEGKKDEVILELQQKIKAKEEEYSPFIEKAKKFDEYDSSKRNKIKSTLGDGWLTSFDNMPLNDLEELAVKLNPDVKLIDSDNGKNKKASGKEFFTLEELKALTPEQLRDKDILAKANKSMEFHSKK